MSNHKLPATTSLRAIDIHGTNKHQTTQEWFFTHERMLQYLAIRQMYVDPIGVIKDSDGEITGMWYFVEFSAKQPPANDADKGGEDNFDREFDRRKEMSLNQGLNAVDNAFMDDREMNHDHLQHRDNSDW